MKTNLVFKIFVLITVLVSSITPAFGNVQPAYAITGSYSNIKLPYKGGTVVQVTGDPTTHGVGRHAADVGMRLADVYAIHSGKVVRKIWDNTGGGNILVIDNQDGFCSNYLHLDQYYVNVGETITQGKIVARSGRTSKKNPDGTPVYTSWHLHVSVTKKIGANCSLAHSQEIAMFFDEKPGQELKKGNQIRSANYGPTSPTYSAVWVSQSSYPTLTQGQSADVSVTFRNTGNTSWSNTGVNATHLGTINPVTGKVDNNYRSPFVCPTWLGPITPANLSETTVAPGNTGTFNFKICVPSNMAPGTYRISVAPLIEGITWMLQPGITVYWDVTVNQSNIPTYNWIGGRVSSSLTIGVQDAVSNFCADNMYQNSIRLQLYRPGVQGGPQRSWDYRISISGSIEQAIYTDAGSPPIDLMDQVRSGTIRIQRYTNAQNVPCYSMINIDGYGGTYGGVRYSAIVWYFTNSNTNNPPPGAYDDPTKCYDRLGGIALCDSAQR
jgi:hypothetical protein